MNAKFSRLILFVCLTIVFTAFSHVKANGYNAAPSDDNSGMSFMKEEKNRSFTSDSLECDFRGTIARTVHTVTDESNARVSYIIETVGGMYLARGLGTEVRDDSLSSLLQEIAVEGASIEFSEVYSEENISIDKSVTLTGTLSLSSAELSLSGDRVELLDFDFYGNCASIRIKRGTAVGTSGVISVSGSTAVLLDFHSGACFLANGIDIAAEWQGAAILCELGSVEIHGGNIVNKYGTAVENHGSLSISPDAVLHGVSYDVVTDKPISLIEGESELPYELRAKYDEFFEKGSFSVIFRGADEGVLPSISLFDASGEKIRLEYFESSKYTNEKNVLAAYLPYTLRLYSGGEIYSSVSFIENEIIEACEGVKKEGYTFLGWYRDTAYTEPYSFGNIESEDFNLYAAHKLEPPEFAISSLEFTYDGKGRTLGFDYLYHTLMNEGQFSFVWYKNGTVMQNSASGLQITNVSDSGSYFCKLTFSYRGDFVTVTSPEITVTVHKKTVFKPSNISKIYSGGAISVDIEESVYFTYEKTSFVDAGEYFIELILRDYSNYGWSDSGTDTTTVKFEILQAENLFLREPAIEDIYETETPRAKYSLKFGDGYLEFSSDGAVWDKAPPSEAGEYLVRVRADETKNYTGVISEPLRFSVLRELCIGIKIDKLPEKTVYRAFETLDLRGAELSATYSSGRSENISLTEIKAEYKNGSCLTVNDTSLVLVFDGSSVPIPVTVLPAEYDLTGLVFEGREVVYDGLRHTLAAYCDAVGKDGIALEYKIVGGGFDVGTYEVSLVFSSESINYELPESITRTLRITPLSVAAEYSNTEFVYDGTAKLPSASLTGVFGMPLSFVVSGAATDAGEYVASVTLNDKNYLLVNPSVAFSIAKADFELSGVYWSAESFTYDGCPHAVSLSGLPNGLTVIGYANASYTEAGAYCAEASVVYDERNYNSPGKFTHEWEIERRDYDLSGFAFSDSEHVYDGEYHFPALSGTLPVGIDGIPLRYSFSEGALHVLEKSLAVTVTFSTQSKNYNTPEPITVNVTITPMPIEVVWENLAFVYDGSAHIPSAKSEICKVKVTGEGINAGKYTAAAYTENADYKITNFEIDFEIAKAENFFTTAFSVNDVFFGDSPNVFAEAFWGEVQYLYYKGHEVSEAISLPLAIGEYYAVATVAESENYLALSSEPLAFSVLEILPVELKIEINEPLFAMHSLFDFSVKAYLLNNNGSQTPISAESLAVEYQNGDSLRAYDTRVSISHGGFSYEAEITVSKNPIRAPIIADVIYNGTVIFPAELTSPLFKTDFEGAKSVGEYEVTLTLTDSDNYELCDGISNVTFKILKAPITLRVKKNGSDYEIVEGRLFEGDTLREEYYEEDGKILLRISNPNYELTVIPREEKSARAYLLIFFLLGIFVILASVGLYIRFFALERQRAGVSELRESPKEKKQERENLNTLSKKEEPHLETLLAVDEAHANNLISDFVAKSLITPLDEAVYTEGKRRYILNLDTISENFSAGECVDINSFKMKGLLPSDARYVKILARGVIDKPIHVRANAFSLAAVKMIALTGGSAKRVKTSRIKNG